MIKIPLAQLPCPASVEIESSDITQPGAFVVHHDGGINAFLNCCPHTSAPLNWQPHEFLDHEQRYIICSVHGALFRPEDGFCITGPCQNQSLTSVPVHIKGTNILVEFDPGDKEKS